MGEIIGQLLLAILESLAELFSCLTGKWLLPLIAGGRVILMPPGMPRNWTPSPFKRSPRGKIGVDAEFAMLVALPFWILLGGGLYFLFRQAVAHRE